MKKDELKTTIYVNGIIDISSIPNREYEIFIKNLRQSIKKYLMKEKEIEKPP